MSRRTIEVTHVVIESQKAAADVRTSLEALIPPIDDEIPVLLTDGVTDRLKQRLDAAPELSIFLKRDHGVLIGLYGKVRDAVQYEIGNPLTASRMTRYQLAAGLYAPLRVIIYEKDDGGSCIEYDLPSSLFGQFGDDRVTEIARGLDVALARSLRRQPAELRNSASTSYRSSVAPLRRRASARSGKASLDSIRGKLARFGATLQ